MPPFEAPDQVYQRSKNETWCSKIHQKNIGGPDELWGNYWNRFNTMRIPIFDEDEYFNAAVAIAEVAKDGEDFEKLFQEKNRQRQKELIAFLYSAAEATDNEEMFPCFAARWAAIRVCQTGYFENFLSLLKGNVFGWEADEVQNGDSDTAGYKDRRSLDEDEEMEDPPNEDGCNLQLPPECETQINTEYDWMYADKQSRARKKAREEDEYRKKRAADIQEINASDDDDGNRQFKRRRLESSTTRTSTSHNSSLIRKRHRVESSATTPSPKTPSIQPMRDLKKRARFNDDDEHRGHKRQKTQDSVPTLPPNAASSVQQIENLEKSLKKRGRSSGDDNDDHHRPKRRRSDCPKPVSPSTQQPADASSKKRFRAEDDDDHAHKRQKTQNSTPDPTGAVSSPMQKAADEEAARKRPGANARRKSRRQTPALGTPDKPQPLRRSTRRSNTSTLRELDRSGKARLVR